MRIEEKIKKNREVFQYSPFFSHPRESISREIAEPFLGSHKVSKVREESDEMLQEQKSVSVGNEVMRGAETQKTKLVFTMKMVSLPSLWLTNIRIRKSG